MSLSRCRGVEVSHPIQSIKIENPSMACHLTLRSPYDRYLNSCNWSDQLESDNFANVLPKSLVPPGSRELLAGNCQCAAVLPRCTSALPTGHDL